ncbi:transcription factor GTE8-like [Syzygium oleosum]|uniref:transcription factor GTE8-like n=1 Tax=Syzygium oleosum TaxID=219896 RepID=UPI0011D1C308|nr:transcription factor GTE8-like [Syzygium oleosum]XP_030476906.1 transcription factor GTE8-like [Syzygium oleosum]XP_056176321.1 transcription factor GTE8-like [Syzygium oleosum]
MMVENARLPGDYYRSSFAPAGESEGSGSSGRIDTEFTVSEDSSGPAKKCINLNTNRGVRFFVPSEVLPLSNISPSERKGLIHRLRLELEQIRILQKKIESQRATGATLSSSSDILSCSNGQNGLQAADAAAAAKKSSAKTSGLKAKVNTPDGKARGWKRGATGKFESVKQASAPRAANPTLMKDCEALLNRLMSHQYGWVFNKPVDVKSLNIPDYFDVIKQPMDLGTIKGKLRSGAYSSPLEFFTDVRLTFSNAMTYNPPSNDVHLMADALNKFFEVRRKTIEKKLAGGGAQPSSTKSAPPEEVKAAKSTSLPKKRKMSSQQEVMPAPHLRVMTDEEKHKLGQELESLLGEMPENIIDFLREHSSNGRESVEEEIEIDIDDLSDDVLFTLRNLLDEYLQEKQKKLECAEPCEIEILNESGFSNSSMQPCRGNNAGDEEVDIGGNEPPVSSHSPMEIEKDSGHNSCSESGIDNVKASDAEKVTKAREIADSEGHRDEKTRSSELIDINRSLSVLDQPEQTSMQKAGSVDSDSFQDGESAPIERQVSPEKLYRAALLKNRFADTILKAREKTLTQGDKGDPEKLRREREELEMQQRKEKARLQAEAKAAEEARRRAEAEALAEAKRKRELEREAARQALLKMEKTVEINENSRFLEDLEMLRTAPGEHLPSSADETSPDHNLEALGSFKLGGSNPLEQLGLFMKADEEEEEAEPPAFSNHEDVEEGEID